MSNRPDHDEPWASLVKIPADVDKDDTVLGPFTAHQSIQLGAMAIILWAGYHATRHLLPPLLLAALALPLATTGVLAVLTRHDGLPLERWLLAAWRHHRAPKRLVPTGGLADVLPWQADLLRHRAAPERIGTLTLPVADIDSDGLLDLGLAGCAALSEAGTVNFALRTPREQQILVTGFGRWLNSLAGPVQILLRTRPLELGPRVAAMRQAAPALPHPLLEQACLDHATFLIDLDQRHELLERHVLLVHREPRLDAAAPARALRRSEESIALLATAEIAVRPLAGTAAFAALSAACDPQTPLHPCPALPHAPVTSGEPQ
ncbi:PrgI family protein [Kitasatospora sp. NBC_01287]|uniref:PrgI family protein n=1 Tax=Kitasatospora sp. NBC_01287 TaxID=2903573 RepID=UPI00224D3CE8|nr:PrgI family protein [Kitasatospora sp. NBC_01287]MCX4750599.1 PrgI family protein [Kitasatospora sp. NBC_01287]